MLEICEFLQNSHLVTESRRCKNFLLTYASFINIITIHSQYISAIMHLKYLVCAWMLRTFTHISFCINITIYSCYNTFKVYPRMLWIFKNISFWINQQNNCKDHGSVYQFHKPIYARNRNWYILVYQYFMICIWLYIFVYHDMFLL